MTLEVVTGVQMRLMTSTYQNNLFCSVPLESWND